MYSQRLDQVLSQIKTPPLFSSGRKLMPINRNGPVTPVTTPPRPQTTFCNIYSSNQLRNNALEHSKRYFEAYGCDISK